MRKRITSTKLNPKFTHKVGDILEVGLVEGTITGYSVDGVSYWTWTKNIVKYSEPI